MVTKAKYNGLIHGMSATRFNPYGLATRGHVAKVLYSALAQQGEIEKWAKSDMTLAELRALLESELPPTTPVYVPSELPVGWAIAETGQQFNAYYSNNIEIFPSGGPGNRVSYWMYFTNGTSLLNLQANVKGNPPEDWHFQTITVADQAFQVYQDVEFDLVLPQAFIFQWGDFGVSLSGDPGTLDTSLQIGSHIPTE